MNALIDTFGRRVTNLRISVTDRCNFRCRYCMPEEGMEWLKRNMLLTYEEIARLARIFASLGVRKVRLTGGEPLMRKDLWKLIRLLRAMDAIEEIALTTNGYFLEEQVHELVAAGLDRVNISLDSLDPQMFNEMVRRDFYQKTWAGIEAAGRAGLNPIKLNVVLIRGLNDKEILKFAELARQRSFVVRFIEFMPIGKSDDWSNEKVITTKEAVDAIGEHYPLVPLSHVDGRHPADRYEFVDGKGEIGFISSVSEPFCADCDRVRLTSDGKFRTCLFAMHETDLRELLRGGAPDSRIVETLVEAVWKKSEGHLINRPGFVRPERTMSQIGG